MRSRPLLAARTICLALVAVTPLAGQTLPDHAPFDEVLGKHLHGTFVDYGALAADPARLDSYIAILGGTDPQDLAAASREAQLAFWINAYNACALKLVVEHYPIKKAGFPRSLVRSLAGVPDISIRQIPGTWSRRFCDVARASRSLDEIEHEIIRPMGDPRIHFAVNCASRSCPVLAGRAYLAETLDDQLDAAVARFIADPAQYRLERGTDPTLWLNKILDWYKEDFSGTEGVIEFLLDYVSPDDAAYLRDHPELDVKYDDYDWTLNDTAVFGTGR
jgi:hypothetical protein